MTGIKVCIISIIFTLAYIFGSVLISSVLFYNKSSGSILKANSKIIGSKLIGQDFKSNTFFHNRPSSIHYKNDISGNSNLPYYSKELKTALTRNYSNFLNLNKNANPDLNLITESASGLDPHITYRGALSQVDRISNATSLSKEELIDLIQKKSKPRILGLFGEKIVNVLELNLELQKKYAKTRS